jgi:hypothetical protein
MDIVTHWYGISIWHDPLEITAMQKLGITHFNVTDAFDDLPTTEETLLEGFRRAIRNLRLLDECDDLSLETLVLILRDTQEWSERWSILSPNGERFGAFAAKIEKDLKGIKRKTKRLLKEAS